MIGICELGVDELKGVVGDKSYNQTWRCKSRTLVDTWFKQYFAWLIFFRYGGIYII